MTNLLLVCGSIRIDGSRSRQLANLLVTTLRANGRLASLTERDVGIHPPASPTQAFTVANHKEPGARTADDLAVLSESDLLIDEFLAADVIVVATPMYNFSVGPGLKAWVDNLIRKDRTFRLTNTGIERLAEGKKMVVISTRGLAYGPGSPFAECDHVSQWMKDIFGFIGVNEFEFITADNLDFASESEAQASMAKAQESINVMLSTW